MAPAQAVRRSAPHQQYLCLPTQAALVGGPRTGGPNDGPRSRRRLHIVRDSLRNQAHSSLKFSPATSMSPRQALSGGVLAAVRQRIARRWGVLPCAGSRFAGRWQHLQLRGCHLQPTTYRTTPVLLSAVVSRCIRSFPRLGCARRQSVPPRLLSQCSFVSRCLRSFPRLGCARRQSVPPRLLSCIFLLSVVAYPFAM